MNNEKPNNPLAEKLDGINSLPEGFSFSANRVWDQIENQLQDKKRKPMLWLRYAAAIVLLASAAIFWILQKEAVTPKQIITRQISEQPIKIKQTEQIAKKQSIEKEKALVSTIKAPEIIAMVQTPIPIQSNPIIDSIQPTETILATVIIPATTTKPAVKPNTVRKKYPVVHLYELYREPEPIYTKTAPKRTIIETDESPVAPVETNRSFWLPKPKPVIITTSLTDNQ